MDQTRLILLLALTIFLVPIHLAIAGSKAGADIPVNGATSILVADGYNHIVDGDWRLDLSSSTVRTIRVTFTQANAALARHAHPLESGGHPREQQPNE